MQAMFLKNPALRVLLGTNALVLLSGYMFAPIYALFVEQLGGGLLDASFTAGVFAFSGVVAALAAGLILDKTEKRREVLSLSYAVSGAGFLAMMGVDSVTWLFIVQAVIGAGNSVMYTAFQAVYSRHLDEKVQGLEWAVWNSMEYLLYFFGAILGGIIVSLTSFAVLFLVIAVLCFGAALYLQAVPREVIS